MASPAASTAGVPAAAGTTNKWLVTVAVTVGTLMGTVDTSIVNVALPSIQAHFGPTRSGARPRSTRSASASSAWGWPDC